MAWKAKEKLMFEAIKATIPELADMRPTKSQYARYDGFSETHIVELKYRKMNYGDSLIERGKARALWESKGDRKAIYASQHGDTIYLYDLAQLAAAKHDFKWESRECNKTSEFYNQSGNGTKISKQVGYIDQDLAFTTIQL